MLGPNPRPWDSRGVREQEEDDDYENSTPPYRDLPPKPGVREEEEDGDDYENSAPPYKDLPPKPGTKTEAPPLPYRPPKVADLKLTPVTKSSPCPGADPDWPPALPPLPATPVPWPGPKTKTPGCLHLQRLVALLCLLLPLAVALGGAALLLTLERNQQLAKEVRALALEQVAWRANVMGLDGLAGLKKDIDRVQADTNQSLMEFRGLLECSTWPCPENWLHFNGKCYYFSPNTKSWEAAQKFCQERFSHLVIISSDAEQEFITKNQQSSRVYWLGMTDRQQEGDWRWLDNSPVRLNIWGPNEPNNRNDMEDCGSMTREGKWNDLPCETTTYWICEHRCACG